MAKLKERNFWFRSRSRLANWSMKRVVGVERGLITAGISYAASGSLLSVARTAAGPRESR